MNSRAIDLAIYLSAVTLAVGVFLPLAALPVIGDVSYHDIADIESYLVAGLAALAPLFLLIGKPGLTTLPMLGIWTTLLYPAIETQLRQDNSNLLSQALDRSQRIMNEFAVDLFTNISDFSWGGFVLLAGLIGLTLSTLIRLFR